MWRSHRHQKNAGIKSMNQTRVSEYSKAGATHPEGELTPHPLIIILTGLFAAEAEKLIAPTSVPDTPPSTPIISTEVVGDVLIKTPDVTALELPSMSIVHPVVCALFQAIQHIAFMCYHLLTEHVPYVLVGAGTASFAAAKAIREKDPKAKVYYVFIMCSRFTIHRRKGRRVCT